MRPFEYQPYRPDTGTIAELMLRSGQLQSDRAQRLAEIAAAQQLNVGQAQATAAAQRGQLLGQTIGGIVQAGTGAVGDYYKAKDDAARTAIFQSQADIAKTKAAQETEAYNRTKGQAAALADAQATRPVGGGPSDSEFDPATPAPRQIATPPTYEESLQRLRAGPHPELVGAFQEAKAKADEAQARTAKAQQEVDDAHSEYLGALMGPVVASGYDPRVARLTLQHAADSGLPGYREVADGILNRIYGRDDLIKVTVDSLLAAAPKAKAAMQKDAEIASNRFKPVSDGGGMFDTQTQTVVPGPPKVPPPKADYTLDNQRFSGATNQVIATGKGKPDPNAVDPAANSGLTGDDLLKTLDPATARDVQAYAEGRKTFPARVQTDPHYKRLMDLVNAYDPTFDASNFTARGKVRSDFTSGASAKTINSLNTVVGHVDDLAKKADALGNVGWQSANELKNWITTKFGSAAVPSFNLVRNGVADELTRVWRQAGGNEADIKGWKEGLNAAESPTQLKEAFSTIAGMLESKLDALKTQRDQGLGRFGADIAIITPRSRTILDRLQGITSAAPAAPAAPAAAPATGSFKVGQFTVTPRASK